VDVAGLIQFVTFRLADALPQGALADRAEDSERPTRVDAVLDAGHGECVLRHPGPAREVERVLLAGDGDAYRLLAWVVMPNHVHVVAEMSGAASLPKVVQRWKGVSARAINRDLGRRGRLWQPEYHDRFIRNQEHLVAAANYTHGNPVAAGLCERGEDWPFSSAHLKAW
jgi:REP element-mobilizing transposase RayT